MSALADFQACFLGAILGEGEVPGRLAIYRRNVLATLVDSLAAAYPVVRRLVGDAFFAEAAARHARLAPSRSANLHDFGEGFADFLAGYPPAAGLPYLADVARLEWAVHACFHAEDKAALDVTRLADVAEPERLRFELHPAVRLVASSHPVAAIHAANGPGRDGTPETAEGPDWLLVRRAGIEVRIEQLPRDEWHFLERLGRGEPLGLACEAFGGQAHDALAHALRRHALAGLYAGCAPAPA